MRAASRHPSSIEVVPTRSLSMLTYRSRVAGTMTSTDLELLAQAAGHRNKADGVSSLMLFDGERIFQWLEGPDDALDRVWASIQRDARHTSIELLDRHATPVRLFGNFELKVAKRVAGRIGSAHVKLVPSDELASLSISADPEAITGFAAMQALARVEYPASHVGLFEAAARRLGDMWQDDQCNEFEVALGLGRLQGCLRRCSQHDFGHTALDGAPAVLVAPLPGESHMLSASLDADAMWRAGWLPRVEFPEDAATLCALVADRWFDALDLSLSAAFRREHWLPRMSKLIGHARAESRNPQLVVVAGGRIFSERPGLAEHVGADAGIKSASFADAAIVRAMAHRAAPLQMAR